MAVEPPRPPLPPVATPPWAVRPAGCGRLGLGLYNVGFDELPTIRDIVAYGRLGLELGATTLWTVDHVFWHLPLLECMTALAAVAASIPDTPVGTAVLQPLLRETSTLARSLASVDEMSNHRLIVGVGAGSFPGEYVAGGVEPAGRGRRLDAAIDELRARWSGTGADRRYALLPVLDPIPPIWVGGSSDAAIARAAVRGDGWFPMAPTLAGAPADLARLAEQAEAAGRPPGAVTPAAVLLVSAGPNGDAAREEGIDVLSKVFRVTRSAASRLLTAGTYEEVAATVRGFWALGFEHVKVQAVNRSPATLIESLFPLLAD